MHLTAFLFLAGASVAVAQQKCLAQNILDKCVRDQTARVEDCGANEWSCLCTTQTDLATCYNNCPNDPKGSSVDQTKTVYCNAAKANSSGSSSGSSTATPTGSASGSDATPTGEAESTESPTLPAGVTASASETGSAAEAASTGAADKIAAPFGLLGAAIGALVML
ncbi:MAG: hypothetical protein M1831_004144 [Alyxoria varia]|nr:MAG: hypothetical protein M1831_004144 [Alyxoria varia]